MLQVGYRNQNTDENLVLVCDIWNESNIDLAAAFNKVQMSCGYHLQWNYGERRDELQKVKISSHCSHFKGCK